LSKNFEFLPGDSLIGAGMVSYSGCFTANFRLSLEKHWTELLKELKI
jgi:hypothetical protein